MRTPGPLDGAYDVALSVVVGKIQTNFTANSPVTDAVLQLLL